MELLKQVIAMDPENVQAVAYLARTLQEQGDTMQALETLTQAVEKNPDVRSLRMTYARLLVDAKHYEDARKQFSRLSAETPENADVGNALGLLLLQTNHPNEAREQFEALIKLGKRSEAAHYYLGQVAELEKDQTAAIAAYRKVDRGEYYLNAQIRVAGLLGDQGKISEARRHLHGLSRTNAQSSIRLYLAEAEMLTNAEYLKDAMSVYNMALTEHPEDHDLLYARAMLAAKLDDIDLLEKDLRDILSRDANNADALNALGYTLADKTDRLDEAMELIQRALTQKPDNFYILDSMGWVLYRLGRYEEAVDYLKRALAQKDDPEVAAHLGEVLWVMGEKQAAQEVWDTALENTPDDERLLKVIKRFSH